MEMIINSHVAAVAALISRASSVLFHFIFLFSDNFGPGICTGCEMCRYGPFTWSVGRNQYHFPTNSNVLLSLSSKYILVK